jgi:hypothetical protein
LSDVLAHVIHVLFILVRVGLLVVNGLVIYQLADIYETVLRKKRTTLIVFVADINFEAMVLIWIVGCIMLVGNWMWKD